MEILLWMVLGAAAGLALGTYIAHRRQESFRSRAADSTDVRDYAQVLIEKSPDGFIVLDEKYTILQVNEAYTRITGRTSEELVGLRPPFPGWDPAQRETLDRYGAMIARGEFGAFEHAYVRKDGTRFPALFNFGGLRTKEGKKFIFATVKDLTEQKRFEDKLKESETAFRRIAETTTDTIYQIDLNGILIYASPAVTRILAYTPEEFVGTHFQTHFLPEDFPAAQDAFIRNLSGEEIRNTELRILGKNGKPVYIEINATPIMKDGKIIGSQGVGRDIADRKRAEDSLRASEARLRTVVESVPFDLLLIDESGRYEMQNSISRDRWGDVVGLRPQDVAPDAATLALWLGNNGRAFAGEVVEKEVSFAVKGEQRHFFNIISPVYEGRDVRSILVVNIDVTERERAETALKESEEKYRLLVENAGAVVNVFDGEGRMLFTNQVGARYLARTPADLIGKSLHELFPKEIADQYLARHKRVIDSNTPEQHEDRVESATGVRWFRSIINPVGDSGGRILAVQVVSHDITELAQAERALRDRDARLRLMISQVPAILWTVDRDLRFTSSMGAGLRALALAPGQVVGKDLYEFFGSDDPDFLPIAMHRRSLAGEALTFEVVWDHSVWETHTEPLRDESGRIVGCLAIGLDVSERKAAEAELKESREKLRALAVKLQSVREEESTNIAREIHDELGQSLIGLKYDLSYLKRRLSRCAEAAERAKLEERISEMYKEIDATIKNVRTLATQLRPQILDDLGLVGAIEWFTQQFDRRTEIRCEMNEYGPAGLGSDLGPERSTAVFRIFQEILLNVRRHARATRVWIDLRGEDDCFILEVRDNGKGIPRDELKRLEGLGILGMRERALVFGGTVSIDSEPGRGTRVEVRIPLVETSEGRRDGGCSTR